MYKLFTTKNFRKSLKKYRKSGTFNEEELECVVKILIAGEVLSLKYRDHKLSGDMKDFRECHIRPDLLLVYRIIEDRLVLLLADLGTHPEIFGK